MTHIAKHPGWWLPERSVTPERVYRNRRQFLKELGITTAAMAALPTAGCAPAEKAPPPAPLDVYSKGYPHPRNPDFDPDWKLTDPKIAGSYNNFYEFSTAKQWVRRLVSRFQISPWPIELTGLVEKPVTLDAVELIDMMNLEERIYRLRCVEAWAMVVPWTGFPFSQIVKLVQPKPEAKFVRFETFYRPKEAPGFADTSYPWPYFEGLRLDEAMNPLTLVTTGIYGKPLPKQHGAPIRMVVPWKYGYKSIKSIVKIEFVADQPTTFWETLLPKEYPFESNVNPKVPHPRWSQATERMIDTGMRVKTKLYNGYGDYVAKLYPPA